MAPLPAWIKKSPNDRGNNLQILLFYLFCKSTSQSYSAHTGLYWIYKSNFIDIWTIATAKAAICVSNSVGIQTRFLTFSITACTTGS
jgi:hypothetical protein